MTGSLPPWRRTRPNKPPAKMTDEQIARARERARRAGRRYPNLVDNMAILTADRAKPR